MSWGGNYGPPPPHGYYPPPHHQQQYPQQYPPLDMNNGYYPPQAGYSHYPPQAGQYPPPAGAPYGGPPPAGYPPQQHGAFHHNQGAFHHNQRISPLPPQQAPYPPPQASAGQYGGFQPMGNPQADAQALQAAMKGLGTREADLIRVLAHVPNDAYMREVQNAYQAIHRRDLIRDLESETSGDFRTALVAVARGPIAQDCQMLYDATHRLGTKESTLNDVLLGRSNFAMYQLKEGYNHMFRGPLVADIRDDLSLKTKELFELVLEGKREEENAPADPHRIQADVDKLYAAMKGRTQQTPVCEVFAHRSDGQLRAISERYRHQHNITLAKQVAKSFSGHMEEALLRMLSCAEDRAKTDADSLEETMKGFGTNEDKLTSRLVRVHWGKEHLNQVKGAYKHFYRRELVDRIRGETSGYYRDLLVALCI